MKSGGKVTNHSNNVSVKKPVNEPCQITKYFRFERRIESVNTTSTEMKVFPKLSKSEIEYKMIGKY